MNHYMNGKTILFYGIPAYGHIYSNLYLTKRLCEKGFRIIYYSLPPFREVIEGNGCEYRPYPLGHSAFDPTDGEKLLKLYRLLLHYTQEMLPELLNQAGKEAPRALIFDSLALWGRAAGQLLQIPSFAFYSIAAVDWQSGKGLAAYAAGFSHGFLRYAAEVSPALKLRRQLKTSYGLKKLGLLPVLMNKGDYNLCGFSREFQPGGRGFGPEYLFLGPLSVHRTVTEKNAFACPRKPFYYISLGTIFNRNQQLLEAVIEQLGSRPGETTPMVILIWDRTKDKMPVSFPENFIVRPFVNQNEILKHASLFITAGGVNSIHEALYFQVPCLLCPQQGEQFLNARQFQRLGFGKILQNPKHLRREAAACMELKTQWNEQKRKKLTAVTLEQTLTLFHETTADNTLERTTS